LKDEGWGARVERILAGAFSLEESDGFEGLGESKKTKAVYLDNEMRNASERCSCEN
jgi:hypothetical protein